MKVRKKNNTKLMLKTLYKIIMYVLTKKYSPELTKGLQNIKDSHESGRRLKTIDKSGHTLIPD